MPGPVGDRGETGPIVSKYKFHANKTLFHAKIFRALHLTRKSVILKPTVLLAHLSRQAHKVSL